MVEDDLLGTRRDVVPMVAAELRVAGFVDADEVGRGGFGVVFRCRQPDLDRVVAVKVLTGELDEENRQRFLREQRAMGRLTGHPNIVNVLQVGVTEAGRPYLVMQYHPQDSLDARIRRHGPLTVEEVLRLGLKIAGALDAAHRLGILHRDVKPANILLTDYGEPALADFGIAHIAGGFTTATGTITGSPAFTAPEVLSGDPPTPAADVYGLGATLFCALTGHAAFERGSGEQLVAQFLRITSQPVPDLRESGIDDVVCTVVERAMSRDPRERPSAAEFGEELQRLQSQCGCAVDEMALRAEPYVQRREGTVAAPVPLTTGPLPVHRQPPIAAGMSPGGKGDIPLELTSFVGRRTEVAAVRALLSSSRLVMLTGIGGVGKTRLALRVAAGSRRAFADGVWLVALGELREGSLVAEMVAGALGVHARPGQTVPQALTEFLASRELLLVLDNCEQVIDAVAGLSEMLLRACGGLRILATSREALGIAGEAVLQVPPLTASGPGHELSLQGVSSYDAVTLFADRATASVPGFELTEDNADTVGAICRRLDGLPLAIELAAARLRAMSPQQILQRLADRYELLTRGSRTAPTRQQTLRWCIDWSYHLCTPTEQLVWARLAVFAGSVELDAAEQVCRCDIAPGDLLDVLTALVEKSVLIREESGSGVRFRMLETVREYGRDKLEQYSEYTDLRRRHRDWYLHLARDAYDGWISSRQLDWIARLDREQANLREALESCQSHDTAPSDTALSFTAALTPFWLARGQISEGKLWLDRALASGSGNLTALRATALRWDCLLTEILGDRSGAAALAAEAQALADKTHNPVIEAFAASADGLCTLFGGDHARACARLEAALTMFSGKADLVMEVSMLLPLGWAYELAGEFQRAHDAQEKLLAIAESHRESVYQSYALWSMAFGAWRQGDHDRALRQLSRGIRLAGQRQDPLVAAICLEIMAWIAHDKDDARRSTVLMGAAEILVRLSASSSVLYPDLVVYHEEHQRAARRVLGRRSFEAAYREGASLDLDAAIAYALREQPKPVVRAPGQSAQLTKREHEVAALVADGLTNREIAARLVISQRTAQGHVEHILTKLGFTSRAQIAAWAVEQRRPEAGEP
ncbi:protein kinase [Nocardia sp. BSTN01]|uniref:protein kinase domain-containing protein n=1 Tax=Nocardia sp. BSTN01 TaxID=2783665 RepID=UPI00188FDA78|nr:protein kinase [Nocardia sp. BSTN01]MBF4996504.1 protein kinase [Nocardia sp. BSTN01]